MIPLSPVGFEPTISGVANAALIHSASGTLRNPRSLPAAGGFVISVDRIVSSMVGNLPDPDTNLPDSFSRFALLSVFRAQLTIPPDLHTFR